jgi:hypothetical protein
MVLGVLGVGYSLPRYIIGREEEIMFGLFGDKSEKEIKQLNKDAQVIIDHARQTFRAELLRDIALQSGEHLGRARKVFEPNPIGLKRAIDDYKRLHQEARRQRQDVLLSAFTLVLIYLRSEQQGEPCQPARDIIDGFIAEWAHAE